MRFDWLIQMFCSRGEELLLIDTELKRKAVVQEGEGVEFEVREAVPIVQQVEEV
jgi:hypothetical protein